MAIRQPPSGIKDPNLRGFLQELRNAIGKTNDQVTKLIQVRSSSGGGGGGGGTDPGGTDPGGGGGGGTEPPAYPTAPTVVLTISPLKPLTEEAFTLTATVAGNQPTGTVLFRQNDDLMTLDPVGLANNIATVTDTAPKGIYTFVAEYSGDPRNLPAVSNVLTVEVGSVWDGPPPSVTTLVALSGIGYIVLKWTIPFVGDLDTIEIWGSLSNDRATATKLGESNGSMFVYTPPANQPTWYFWVRVRDAEGLFSDYFPNTTQGVMGTALSLEDEIAATPLWNDLGTRLDDLDIEIETQVSQLQGQIDEVLGAPDYDAATTYQANDIVKYSGSIYRAKQTTTGNLPTNTTYWELIGNYRSIGEAVAAHSSQITILNTGLSAEVSARETLGARVTSAEGDIITQAGYINNRYTKAEADAAVASSLTGVVASYQAADTNNLNASKTYSDAAVSTEATARASADASLATQLNTVSATAGAKNRTYRQTTAPTSGMTAGDIWFDSDDNNKAYRYNGTSWELTDDTRIAANTAAIQTESTARATADAALASQITTVVATANSKNKTYRQTTAPTSDMIAGDIWFDSDDNNKAYRYNGTAWELTDDTRIAQNTAAIQTETTARADADSAIASQVTTLQSSVAGNTATLQTQATVIDGIKASYMVKTDVNGLVAGFGLYNNGEVSDFFVRADRFAVGNPAVYRGGTCSIAGHTTAEACRAAGGTWTWTDASTQNIPFIVYTTAQTITAPDGSGRTLTVQPGVYMKSANIQKAFIGDAEIYGDLKSYSWAASSGPTTFPFNGWKLDKASNLALYGGSFALYDEWGNPIITAGKVAFNQFRRLIVSASAELFTIPKLPATAVTPSTIALTATLQNISGTVTWTVTSGTYGGTLGTGVQKTIDPAQMTTSVVTFKATTTVDSVVYEDSVTLAKVQEGSDALWLYLSNEAHLVPADASGNVTSYAGASTAAKMYRGAVDVTTSESWTISAPSYTGLSSAPTISAQTVSVTAGMTADVATITVRASRSEQTLDRIFTLSKAKQGTTGPQGPQGAAGAQGNSLFTWIAYANNNTGTAGFTTGVWSGQTHIGIANNQTSSTEGTDPTVYTWSLIKGDQGVPGTPGADGQTTYTWFAYANDATGSSGFTTGNWTNQTYMGIAANKTTATESTNPTDYTWSKIQGPSGSNGLNSAVIYLYRRSVATPSLPSATVSYDFTTKLATGLSNSWTTTIPAGTDPIWVTAATASSATNTDTIAINEWASATVLAQNGSNGSNGSNGVDGLNSATVYIYRRSTTAPARPSATTTYTFATKALTGLDGGWTTTIPAGADPIYVSTATAVANTATDTILAPEWATVQILAQNGTNGTNGTNGVRGSVSAYIQTFSASAAWNAIVTRAGSNPVPGDYVETESGARHAYTSGGNGTTSFGNWTTGQSVAFSGNVIVRDTLTANKLAAGAIGSHLIELGAYNNDPNAIIQSRGFATGSGWRIDGAGNAEFNNAKVRGDILLGGGNQIQNSEGLHGLADVSKWVVAGVETTPSVAGNTSFGTFTNVPSGGTTFFIAHTAFQSTQLDARLFWYRPGTTSGFPVTPGRAYQLSCYVAVLVGGTGQLWLDWQDGNGNFIQGMFVGQTANVVADASNLSNWTRLFATLVAPSNARRAVPWVRKLSSNTSTLASTGFTRLMFAEAESTQTSPIPWSPGGISLLDALALKNTAFVRVAELGGLTVNSGSIPTGNPSTPHSIYSSSYSFLHASGKSIKALISVMFECPLATSYVEVSFNGVVNVLYDRRGDGSSPGIAAKYFSATTVTSTTVPTTLSATVAVAVRQVSGNAATYRDIIVRVQELYA